MTSQATSSGWCLPYAVHLGILSRDTPHFLETVGSADPVEQIRYVSSLGFAGICDNLVRERDLDEIKRMARQIETTDLRFGSFIASRPGSANLPWHIKGPDARSSVLKHMKKCSALAERLNAEAVLIVAQMDDSADKGEQLLTLRDHLAASAELFEGQVTKLALEPVCALRVPGLLVRRMDEALEVVRSADIPKVEIMFDTFHIHATDGDVVSALRAVAGRISGIQLADYPNRHEPGSGEIDFVSFLKAYKDIGCPGMVELEHLHSSPGKAGEQLSLERLKHIDTSVGSKT